jgi:hypothetical protein
LIELDTGLHWTALRRLLRTVVDSPPAAEEPAIRLVSVGGGEIWLMTVGSDNSCRTNYIAVATTTTIKSLLQLHHYPVVYTCIFKDFCV